MNQLDDNTHKKLWFEGFIYIFNLHWDKVDNYRIDKYLMFMRFQFGQLIQFLKDNEYKQEIQWYQSLISNLIMDSQNSANLTAQGISL